ncbi:hypothetical protein [Kineococcus glutinatus]|uniref:Antibiotic biosynthesis monooxygenase n=1 Tax=Kineococcus glutinatus TaxID=1070872 RepID=A0ABP9I6L4_9ACTN
MAFVRLAFFPGATREHFAAVEAAVGDVAPPPARRLFAAGPVPGGWQVVQVWRTAADLEEFNRTVYLPALRRLGAPPWPQPPQVTDLEAAVLLPEEYPPPADAGPAVAGKDPGGARGYSGGDPAQGDATAERGRAGPTH